jgi:hypothetical protein
MPPSKPYSIARADLVANQIERFASQHLHQLAGHHANLEFWLSEAACALQAIDAYQQRYNRLANAQLAWVSEHDTKISRYCPICGGGCEFGPQRPPRPHLIPSEELTAACESVRRAVRQFLVRLYQANFITDTQLRQHGETVGMSIEPEDL